MKSRPERRWQSCRSGPTTRVTGAHNSDYLGDDEFCALQQALIQTPEAGPVISGTSVAPGREV
jgi:hypothetical protein